MLSLRKGESNSSPPKSSRLDYHNDWYIFWGRVRKEFDNSDRWHELRNDYQNDIRSSCEIAENYEVPGKLSERHEELKLSCAKIDLGFVMIALGFTLDDIDSVADSLDIVTEGVKDIGPYASWLSQQ